MARGRLALVAVLAVAATIVVACGNDGGESGEAGSDEQVTTQPAGSGEAGSGEQVTTQPAGSGEGEAEAEAEEVPEADGPPIRVMVYTAAEGVPTPFPEAFVGAQAAAKSINAVGGVGGRPIEVVECDIGADPNGPVRCARQAVDEGMVAVIGSLDPTGDSLGVLHEAGIPSISPYPRLAELSSPIAYPVTTGGAALVAGAITALADQGHERINVVYSDIPGTAAIVAVVGNLVTQSRGVVLRTTAVPQPSGDLAPIVADAARDVDAIAVVTTSTDAAKFVAAARQTGLDLPIAGHSIAFDEETLGMLGDAAEGLLVATNFKPPSLTDDPTVALFVAEMDAIDPGARKNDVSMGAWLGVRLFAEIAAGLANLDSAALIEALDAVDGLEMGLVPAVSFAHPNEVVPGLVRIFNTKVMYSEVVNGVLSPLDEEFVDVFSAD